LIQQEGFTMNQRMKPTASPQSLLLPLPYILKIRSLCKTDVSYM